MSDYFILGELINPPQTEEEILDMMNKLKMCDTKEAADKGDLDSLFGHQKPQEQDMIYSVRKTEGFDPNSLITEAKPNIISGWRMRLIINRHQ